MQDMGSARSWGDKGCWNRSGTAGVGQTRDSGWEQIRNSRHETDNRITEIMDEGGGYVHSKKKWKAPAVPTLREGMGRV